MPTNKIHNPYTVVIDTLEKVGIWDFPIFENRHLKTGDYSIAGYEDILCLERKRTTGEIAANSTEQRFIRELERMTLFKYKFMLLEFTMDDVLRFPNNSTIPRKRWPQLKVTSEFIFKFLMEASVHYGVNIMFCGDRENAIAAATKIMNRVVKDNPTRLGNNGDKC